MTTTEIIFWAGLLCPIWIAAILRIMRIKFSRRGTAGALVGLNLLPLFPLVLTYGWRGAIFLFFILIFIPILNLIASTAVLLALRVSPFVSTAK